MCTADRRLLPVDAAAASVVCFLTARLPAEQLAQ